MFINTIILWPSPKKITSLAVSTHWKHIHQIGSFSPIKIKLKTVWNHLVTICRTHQVSCAHHGVYTKPELAFIFWKVNRLCRSDRSPAIGAFDPAVGDANALQVWSLHPAIHTKMVLLCFSWSHRLKVIIWFIFPFYYHLGRGWLGRRGFPPRQPLPRQGESFPPPLGCSRKLVKRQQVNGLYPQYIPFTSRFHDPNISHLYYLAVSKPI